MQQKTVYVITDKSKDLNGIITNVNEKEVSIVWENEETKKLTNEELEALLDTNNFVVEEVEINEDEGGETPAQATIHTHKTADATDGDADGNPKTRLDWIRQIVGQMADMDTESLVKIFNDQQALIGGEAERAGTAKDVNQNRASIVMKPSNALGKSPIYTESVKLQKEEMDTIFGETSLTEEAKTKLTTLWESSVALGITEEVVKIKEDFDNKFSKAIADITEELIDNVNTYFDHVVEEWITENEVAIESTLKTELTSEFIDGLKGLFKEHYIDIPEERVEVYENLVKDYEESKKKLNKVLDESIEKDKVIKGFKKDKIVSEASLGLTLPQIQKLKNLTETIDFENEDSFKNKVKTIKEGFIDKSSKTSNILSEKVEETANTVVIENEDPNMKAYFEAIRQNKKFSHNNL